MRYSWLVFCAVAATAQVNTQTANPCIQQGCYVASISGTVTSSSTSKLTIQQPATGGRQVTYIAAVAQCPGQTFTIDQSQNGTAASSTAGTAVPLIPTTTAAAAKVFTASNVGAGTATALTLAFSNVGDARVINLSNRTTGLSGTANNYTITLTNTGAGSCTGGISIYWSEKI